MGLRFIRRVRVMPGVRLNLGKRGASLSFGGRGARVTYGRRGMRTTAGLPGSGLSYTNYQRYGAAKRSSALPDTAAGTAPRVRWGAILLVTVVAVALLLLFSV